MLLLFYNYTHISSTFLELLIVFYVLNFLDVITTNYGLRMGAYELNPLAYLMWKKYKLKGLSVLKFIMILFYTYGLFYAYSISVNYTIILLTIIDLIFVAVVVNNILTLRELFYYEMD